MRKILRYTFYLFLPYLLLLSTGLVWHVTHMDKSDLDWMSHYQTGDCEYFISQYGHMDALQVREKNIRNTYTLINNSIGNHSYIAGGHIHYIIVHKNDTIEGCWGVRKVEQNEPVFVSFRLGDRFNNDTGNAEEIFSYVFPQIQPVIINGTKVTDCVVADDKNSDWGKYQIGYGVTGFVWSKSKGLLQYSFLGGEVFTRIEFTDFGKEIGLKRN